MSGFFNKAEKFLVRNPKLKGLLAVTVFACGGLQASYAAAATCYADSVSALQACLNNAAADEENWHEIQLNEKTYYLTSPLTLTKGKVRLVGAGRVSDDGEGRAGEPYSAKIARASDRKALERAKFFVLDGQNQTRIFSAVDEGVPGAETLILYIQGLTFRNGNPIDNEGGGGLLFKGRKLIIEHSIFTENSDSALAHYAKDQQSISDSYFYDNTAEHSTSSACPPTGTPKYWGGAITALVDGSDYVINRSTFENNRGCRGGAIWSAAEMTLIASTVSNNTAVLGGGVYVANAGSATGSQGIIGSTIYKNHASNLGGGLYLEQQRSSEWNFSDNILAGNSASPLHGTFSDCYVGANTEIFPNYIGDNILGRIGVGSSVGDCSPWLNPDSNQTTGVVNPGLEELAYNGSIGLQLKTHLPKVSSVSLDVASSYDGMCTDQRARDSTVAASPQNKCAAGATQRRQQENGTLGEFEAPFVFSTVYKMVLPESQSVQIDLASDEADALLILSDANDNEIETNNDYDSPNSNNARITRQLSAGVYYIFAKHDVDSGYGLHLRDFFLSVNAEVELTPSLVFMDNAEIADRPTLGQTGTALWKRSYYPRPSGTSGWFYKMESTTQWTTAIFESDFFDPADTQLFFRYFLNGANSGSLYLDIELNGVWHNNYWIRSSSNSNHRSPNWQQASYDFNSLSSQGHDKIRIRLYGFQDQPPHSSHSLLLDKIEISRYGAWLY